jgi:hypothetical protein
MTFSLWLRISARLLAVVVLSAAGSGNPVWGYEARLHQQLTFIAAKQFNRCVSGTAIPTLSALDVRYVAKANASQAQTNVFTRMFRWSYYDRAREHDDVASDDSMLWMIDTRFHDHFDVLTKALFEAASDAERYRSLGRLIGYMQEVTSPAHAVPVYTGRWWRLSMGDRFDKYKLDVDAVAAEVGDACDYVTAPVESYNKILTDAAQDTLTAVQAPMFGMPVTWEVFWKLADNPSEFGEYGRAGNKFGDATEFRCGDVRCVLLDRDPLYRDFALQRHVAAVVASMRAFYLLQGGPQISDTNETQSGDPDR